MGHSGPFGYVGFTPAIPAERAALVLSEITPQLPAHVKEFGHDTLPDSGQPFTQFAFVVTMAGNPKMTDAIVGIAQRIISILDRHGYQVSMDGVVHEVSRLRPLLRNRTPVDPAERRAKLADLGISLVER